MSVKKYKILAEALLVIPIGLLLFLGFGEIFGGDIYGVQHFVQLLPLLVLAVFAWFHPQKMGMFIFLIGIIAFVAYLIMSGQFSLWVRIINGFLLFGTPILSGALFVKSSK